MKAKLLLIFCLMLVLVSSAFAVTVSDVSLDADDDVERSNPYEAGSDDEYDDNDDTLSYVKFSIPVTADSGDVKVTNVTLASGFTYAPFTDELEDEETFIIDTSLPVTVTNGTTKTIVVSVLVPENLDAIDTSFNRVEHDVIANVVTNQTTESSTLSFYVENGLELDDVEIITPTENIDCDVDEGDLELDCDDEIEELAINEDFVLEFVIRNIFDSDSDLDFTDVEIEIDSEDRDVEADDDNFDEDIDADDEVKITMDFSVDLDDDQDVDITITAIVEDENGALHGFEYVIPAQFEIKDYAIDVSDIILSPANVCQGESARVSFEVENTGSKDQNNVRIQLSNSALNLNEIQDRIELEDQDSSDNDYRGDFTVTTTSNTPAGDYQLTFIVYYRDEDSNNAEEFQAVNLIVRDCEGDDAEPTTNGDSQDTNTNNPVIVVQQPPAEPTVVEPTQNENLVTATVAKKGSVNVWLIVGLVVVILLILGLIGVIISLLRK